MLPKIKVSTFLKIELLVLFLITFFVCFVGYTTVKNAKCHIYEINKNILLKENEIINLSKCLNTYLIYDAKAYVKSNNTAIITVQQYSAQTDSFRNYIYLKVNDKEIDSVISTKPKLLINYYNILNAKYPHLVAYKQISVNSYVKKDSKKLLIVSTLNIDTVRKDIMVPDTKQTENLGIVYRSTKDSQLIKIMNKRIETNIVIESKIHNYIDSLFTSNEIMISGLNNDITVKFKRLSLIYLSLCPIFFLSLTLLIIDIGKLFRRNAIKESFIETIIKMQQEKSKD